MALAFVAQFIRGAMSFGVPKAIAAFVVVLSVLAFPGPMLLDRVRSGSDCRKGRRRVADNDAIYPQLLSGACGACGFRFFDPETAVERDDAQRCSACTATWMPRWWYLGWDEPLTAYPEGKAHPGVVGEARDGRGRRFPLWWYEDQAERKKRTRVFWSKPTRWVIISIPVLLLLLLLGLCVPMVLNDRTTHIYGLPAVLSAVALLISVALGIVVLTRSARRFDREDTHAKLKLRVCPHCLSPLSPSPFPRDPLMLCDCGAAWPLPDDAEAVTLSP